MNSDWCTGLAVGWAVGRVRLVRIGRQTRESKLTHVFFPLRLAALVVDPVVEFRVVEGSEWPRPFSLAQPRDLTP